MSKTQLIAGIDEAGYGPRLGPLVVSCYMLRVPDDAAPDGGDLWARLADCVVKPGEKANAGQIRVGDSKQIYSPARGPAELERSALALVGWAAGRAISSVDDLLAALLGEAGDAPALSELWQQAKYGRFPLADDGAANKTPAGLRPQRTENQALWAASCLIPAAEFNRALSRMETPNKSLVNWQAVVQLLRGAWRIAAEAPLSVTIDRQGGRKYYTNLLQEAFPGGIVRELQCGPQLSAYRIEAAGRQLTISFRTRADAASFPVAAASLISKYLRELMMARLNGFFRRHDPNVKPTAGYPGDAGRFLAQTAALRRRLGIDDAAFVRER